jgi:hypothetical protein
MGLSNAALYQGLINALLNFAGRPPPHDRDAEHREYCGTAA